MSIVPMSALTCSDAARLGTNVASARRGRAPAAAAAPGRRRRKGRRLVAAVNRSLAGVGERIARLYAW